MEPSGHIFFSAIEIVVSKIAEFLASNLESSLSRSSQEKISEGRLQLHLERISNWSRRVEFIGLSSALDTQKATIPLYLYATERRFTAAGSGNSREKILSEEQVLLSASHYVVLGGPGSGKTTTLKRLALKLLAESGASKGKNFKFPLVFRLRDLDLRVLTLHEAIADSLGVSFRRRTSRVFSSSEYVRKRRDLEDKKKGLMGRIESVSEQLSRLVETGHSPKFESRFRSELEVLNAQLESARGITEGQLKASAEIDLVESVVGEEDLLENFLPNLLDASGAMVLLDGLDEVASEHSEMLQKEVTSLSRSLSKSRVLVTCRTGDFRQLHGFDRIELSDLSEDQALSISSKLLKDPSDFVRETKGLPYLDLLNRPLFLAYLAVIYRSRGALPRRPADVYGRIVRLCLEDWDADKGVKRTSRYAVDFDSDRKADFLAALAYHLTYRKRVRSFSRAVLLEIYQEIYEAFGLGADAGEEVVREIQSHTGLVVEAGFDTYEFSHLSLQEYLCASFLVRSALVERATFYLAQNPAPVAVATAISSNPGDWLASVVLSSAAVDPISPTRVRSLLERLQQERPNFFGSEYIGYAVVKLFFFASEVVREFLPWFLTTRNVADSIRDALKGYIVYEEREGLRLMLQGDAGTTSSIRRPTSGVVPRQDFRFLLTDLDMSMIRMSDGMTYRIS